MTTCKNCTFRDTTTSTCRANPPQVSVLLVPSGVNPLTRQAMMQPQPVAAFPPVDDEGWCGRYSPNISLAS